ncbi:hypothetical protein FRC01_004287 [Tulasnella sp. 417]|nr:hypothetical protein FRC01_004287 [Tulasnella sp. 417]
MHCPPFFSSPTTNSPIAPFFACQADAYAPSDIIALAQTLVCLAASASSPSSPLDIFRRLDSIDEEVKSVKEQTTRALTALNAKVDRLLNAAEVRVVPLGSFTEALDRQTRQCKAELEGFRLQLAEVVADTKELMDAIDEAETNASTQVSFCDSLGVFELTL